LVGRVKDRLGDQRGGSEWELIKIFLQRENSAYAPNSQPRIPTRVCQGHVVTTDLPTIGTNLKQSRSESTIQEAKDLAVLQYTRWTVHGLRVDRPRGYGGPSAGCGGLSEKTSPLTSTAPSVTDRLRWARGPPPRHGLDDTLVRTVRELRATKIHRHNESNKRH
jgi:hypothetical protein